MTPSEPDRPVAPIDPVAVEAALRERLAVLSDRIGGMAKPPERGAGISFGKRIGDGTSEAISRMTDARVGPRLELSEARIVRALEKLDDGSYGVCDSCGRPIAPARLTAAPESVLCIECARRAR